MKRSKLKKKYDGGKEEDWKNLADEINKMKTDENTKNIIESISKLNKVEIEDKYKIDAIILSAEKGFYDISILILDSLVNINAPLIMASYKGSVNTVKLLLKRKDLDVNFKDIKGWTALMYSSYKGHIEIVKLLLKTKKIDVNIKGENGWTALMHSSSEKQYEIVKLLLETENIDVNVKDNDGWTVLIDSSKEGDVGIIKLLLKHNNIDVNAKTNSGWTALMMSSNTNHIEIVKLLLNEKEKDINITCKNDEGFTALDLAVSNNNEEIVKMLLSYVKKQHMNSIELSIHNKTWNITKIFDDVYKIKCVICYQNEVRILFNCGHAVTCIECYNKLDEPKKCPVCVKTITKMYGNIEARDFNSIEC